MDSDPKVRPSLALYPGAIYFRELILSVLKYKLRIAPVPCYPMMQDQMHSHVQEGFSKQKALCKWRCQDPWCSPSSEIMLQIWVQTG